MSETIITWLGHASIKVESNGLIFYFDPWLDDNPACSLSLEGVNNADVVAITHGHRDHLGDGPEIAKKTGAMIVCHPGIGFYLRSLGLNEGENYYPLAPGGSWLSDRFVITMVNSVHMSDIMSGGFDFEKMKIGSGSVGYVLALTGGPTVYFSGDTDVFGDMAIIRELHTPDIAILAAGGRFNMGYREAAYATGLLQPRYVIAIHHSTWPNQALDFDKFEIAMNTRAPKAKLIRLKPSESFTYS